MWTRTWLTSSATESRCNKYFSPIPYDPWNQSTAPGKREKIEKERERERERERRETWFPWHRTREQVLREIMQTAAFFTFYMDEHDHLQASLSCIGRICHPRGYEMTSCDRSHKVRTTIFIRSIESRMT